MAISNWPEFDRPREKLINFGAESLSDSELLAIFLRTGSHGKSAIDLARDLLNKYGDIKSMLDADINNFCSNFGMGKTKFVQFQAALEFGKRYLEEKLHNQPEISSPSVTKQFLSTALRKYQHEVFSCMFLDSQHKLIKFEVLFEGTINQSAVYPREILKMCLSYNAKAVIIAHNHPSGSCQPSGDDITITSRISEALSLVDIDLLDHIIVGIGSPLSFAEEQISW